jgi:hypothetical protein
LVLRFFACLGVALARNLRLNYGVSRGLVRNLFTSFDFIRFDRIAIGSRL